VLKYLKFDRNKFPISLPVRGRGVVVHHDHDDDVCVEAMMMMMPSHISRDLPTVNPFVGLQTIIIRDIMIVEQTYINDCRTCS
jgi:hypothetical protein